MCLCTVYCIWASFRNNDQETKIFPCRLYNTYFVLYLGKAVSSVEAASAEEWGELCLEAEPHRVTIVTQRGATSLNRVLLLKIKKVEESVNFVLKLSLTV